MVGDDAHALKDIGRAWIMAAAESNTSEAVMDAIRRGRFYGSTGVPLSRIGRTGDVVHIETGEEARIDAIGRAGRLLARHSETRATFDFSGAQTPYIRFQLMDRNWGQTWTQPFFRNEGEANLMQALLTALRTYPVIAAVCETTDMERTLASSITIHFMMSGSISEVRDITRRTHEAGKHIFFHVDLVKGLGRDKEAIRFLADEAQPDGMVSTKPNLLGLARRLGLLTVLQVFMIDSQTCQTGINSSASSSWPSPTTSSTRPASTAWAK